MLPRTYDVAISDTGAFMLSAKDYDGPNANMTVTTFACRTPDVTLTPGYCGALAGTAPALTAACIGMAVAAAPVGSTVYLSSMMICGGGGGGGVSVAGVTQCGRWRDLIWGMLMAEVCEKIFETVCHGSYPTPK